MTIKFSKVLYTKKAILLAIEVYTGLANFSISEIENEFIVRIKNIDSDLADIFREEFCNYVLAIMKK